MEGRILGLDVGERRVGVALSDALGLTAGRLMVLNRQATAASDAEAIRQLVEQHNVQMIVVGLPLTMRGDRGPQARKVEAFVQTLRQRLVVPIRLIDERLTTVQSQRVLREIRLPHRSRKQVVDQVAAQLILQQFLERQRQKQESQT